MKRLLVILISALSLVTLVGCSEDNWTLPTTLKGGVWELQTPMPLQDYFTYQPGRCIAFSEKSSRGWIGTDEKVSLKGFLSSGIPFTRGSSLERSSI